MKTNELEQYQKLTKFQKDVVDALIILGFKHKYSSIYESIKYGEIQVDHFYLWSEVLNYVFEQGKHIKCREMQKVIGLP